MNKLYDKSTLTGNLKGSFWRIHRDYPSILPYPLPDPDISTLTPLELYEEIELPLETTREIIKSIIENRGIQELCKLYIELINKIQEVKKVILFKSDDANCILTIIEALAFDFSIRKRIYEAEQVVMERILNSSIEFRLINSSELQEDLSKIIPDDATMLYKR